MKKTIGIIAPLIDRQQLHADFNLRLRLNNRELTLLTLYDLARKDFNPALVARGLNHEENIPAAGYYLEGLLHEQGYNTLLTNKYDAGTIASMATHDPFMVLVSTTMIVTTESLVELLSSIRKAMPDTKIIVGGVLVWKNYLLYKSHLAAPGLYPLEPWMIFHPGHANMDADVLVPASHGRSSLLEVITAIEKGSNASFDEIPNLAIPGPKGFFFTRRVEEIVDYNEDYTRWDLVSDIPFKIPVRTSIGCPYRCGFCDFYKLFPSTFLRSAKSLSGELKLIRESLGQKSAILHVSDDNVFITKKHAREVCTAITESGIRKWMGFMRAGEYSEPEIDMIEHSGLLMGMIGVESGDPGQLRRMNKRQKIEDVKRGVEQLDAHGIITVMTFVVGYPGENEDTLKNTAGFLNSLNLKNLSANYLLFPLLVQPLSELAEPSNRTKWKIEGSVDQWSHSTMNFHDATTASYQLFKSVSNVTYHYFEESNIFNRMKFDAQTRNSLFQLRHQLTIKLIEQSPWNQIEPLLISMAAQMKISVNSIPESFRESITGYLPYPAV